MLNMQNLDRLACLTGSLAKYVTIHEPYKCILSYLVDIYDMLTYLRARMP
jgi:hypothetical protein